MNAYIIYKFIIRFLRKRLDFIAKYGYHKSTYRGRQEENFGGCIPVFFLSKFILYIEYHKKDNH
mgnify:CR=1 FL=1